jgi:hypothetical protein
MKNYEKLNLKIANQENIILSRGHEIFRLMISLYTMLSLVLFTLIFFYFKISLISIFTFILLSSFYLILVKKQKKYVSAFIKGEMLLVQDGSNKNKATSLKSIKSISTYTIFKMNFTSITFKLDGRNHQICLVKKIESDQLVNAEIIKAAMKVAS